MIKEITTYRRALFDKLENAYLLASKNKDEPSIHQLRVNLKKLRAFYGFLGQLWPEKFIVKQRFSFLKQLFKAIGNLRDFQVLEIVLLSYKKHLLLRARSFHTHIRNQENFYLNNFADWDQKYFNQASFKKHSRVLIPYCKVTDKKIIQASDQLIGKWLAGIRDSPAKSEKQWHRIRILLKRIKYIIEMLQKLGLSDTQQDEKQKLIKTLEELLGKWHDLVFAQAEIEKFLTRRKATNEYGLLVHHIKKDKRELLGAVKILIRDL